MNAPQTMHELNEYQHTITVSSTSLNENKEEYERTTKTRTTAKLEAKPMMHGSQQPKESFSANEYPLKNTLALNR